MTTQTSEEQLAQVIAERDKARADLASALAPNAADDALDAIAVACGCAEWEYPAQVERDVLAVVKERDAAVAQRDALAGAVRDALASGEAYALEATRWKREYIPAEGVQRARIADARKVVAATRKTLADVLTATPVAMVRAEVVRAYLVAQHTATQRGATNADVDALRTARTALDTALAAAGGV